MEGVHVDLSLCSPGDVGWKALMGALSDLAAMGATPLGALVALCVPGGAGEGELALGVMAGVAEASAVAGCSVVGGDVSQSGVLVVAVTVLGTVEDGGAPVSRSGARPDDVLLLTGPCGGSAAGLRILRAGTGPGRGLPPPAGAPARGPAGAACRGARHDRRLRRPRPSICTGWPTPRASASASTRSRPPSGRPSTRPSGAARTTSCCSPSSAAEADGLVSAFEAEGLRLPARVGTVMADPALRLFGDGPLERLGWQHRLG